MLEPTQLVAELSQCVGTEAYYQHWTRQLIYTDGIQTLAQGAEAYWLIGAIASHQSFLKKKYPETCQRQTWILSVTLSQMASLICRLDEAEPVIRQEILYTDFPLDHFELYCFDSILLLPSEY